MGTFQSFENPKDKSGSKQRFLEKGTITHSDGSQWVGEFDEFEWLPKLHSHVHMYAFAGTLIDGHGKKTDGKWRCVNTGNIHKIVKVLSG